MMYETIYRAMHGGTAGRAVPRSIVDVLGDVAEGRTDIVAVRHPLGFVCLPLERTGEQGVCVHLWSDGLAQALPTTSATHAHSWDLISYVLYGTVRNELIGVTDAPQWPTHRVFEIGTSADGDDIRQTRRLVRRRTEVSALHRQGEVYSLPAGVFHETVPQGEAATVALGRGRAGAVDLALGAVHTGNHRIRRQLYDREQTAYAATVVAERLAAVPEPRHREVRCERGTRRH